MACAPRVQRRPGIIHAVGDDDREVRKMVLMALGDIGSEAAAAIPAVLQALRDTNYAVRKMAARTLQKIDPSVARSRAA